MFRFAQFATGRIRRGGHDTEFMITSSEPDERGHWGKFGGRYVPETLVAPLEELTNEFMRARHDNSFWRASSICYCGITLAGQRHCLKRSG